CQPLRGGGACKVAGTVSPSFTLPSFLPCRCACVPCPRQGSSVPTALRPSCQGACPLPVAGHRARRTRQPRRRGRGPAPAPLPTKVLEPPAPAWQRRSGSSPRGRPVPPVTVRTARATPSSVRQSPVRSSLVPPFAGDLIAHCSPIVLQCKPRR